MGSKRRGHAIYSSDVLEGRMRCGVVPSFKTAEKFIEAKVKMIRDDFKIQLTDEDITYLHRFKTEHDINAAVRVLIDKHWR